MRLDALFGGGTSAQVLLYLAVNETAYAQQIADALELTLSAVQKQLRRLELGGVLVSRLVGRTRLFSINPRSVLSSDLKALLKRSFSLLSDEAQLPFESQRTRPRLTAKPLKLEGRRPARSRVS